jgi:hypothetical protein
MSTPERLLAGKATAFERQLLGSWQARQPSAAARAQVLAHVTRVGIGVGTVALAATTAKTAGGSIAPKALVASSALVKWLTIGAIGATLTAGTVGYVHHIRQIEVAEPSTVTAPLQIRIFTPPTPPAQNAPPVAKADSPAIELGPSMAPAADNRGAPRSRDVATPKSTLDDEVAMVARARAARAAGDAAGAIQLLDTYDSKYPAGSLVRESTELRIEALIAQGNRPAAERLAERFIASHPSSLDVRNIRRALDRAAP